MSASGLGLWRVCPKPPAKNVERLCVFALFAGVMFSVVLPGRLPLTQPQQVDETHCVFPLQQASEISHVVVFMTGVQPFPPGYAATVHLCWPAPNSTTPETWQLLGCLRNDKPSAIFRIRGSAPSGETPQTATLGISIEPDQLVDQQLATLPSSAPKQLTSGPSSGTAPHQGAEAAAQTLAPQIAKNAFDYLSSFAPDSAPQTVPLLQKWIQQLERKLKAQGPDFLFKQE